MAASPVGMKRFYAILGAVAVTGIGVLGYQLSKPGTVSIPANVTITLRTRRDSAATSRGPTARRSRSPSSPTTSAPSARRSRPCRCPRSRSGSSRPADSGGATATSRCSSTPSRASPPTRRPAPTSKGSSGPSTRRSTRARPSGPWRRRGGDLPPLRRGDRPRPREVRCLHVRGQVRGAHPGQLRRGSPGGRHLDSDTARGRPPDQGRLDSDAITHIVDSLSPRPAGAK